jgi:hypothetical protein
LLAKINVLSAPALPLHRHDSASPRSAPATPNAPFEIENLGVGAEPEPQQKLRRQPRDVVAGRTIDLDEITTPQILNPRQIQGLHSGLRSWNCPRGLVNRDHASLTLLYYEVFATEAPGKRTQHPL